VRFFSDAASRRSRLDFSSKVSSTRSRVDVDTSFEVMVGSMRWRDVPIIAVFAREAAEIKALFDTDA